MPGCGLVVLVHKPYFYWRVELSNEPIKHIFWMLITFQNCTYAAL